MSIAAKALVLALSAAAVATVTDARAEDRATGASSAAFSSLPSGTMLVPPKAKAPASIPGSEKVPGFFLAGRKGRSDYVTIAPTAKAAKQINEGFREESSLAGEACFTEDQPARRGFEEGERIWRSDLQPILTLSSSVLRGQRATVTAVHSERIVEENGKTTLQLADAWVDPTTRGARLIARSSMPLELVSTLLGGTKLYAARDGQNVHVVLLTPRTHRTSGQSGVFAIAGSDVSQSGCDHMRATMKTEKGQGQTVSFVSDVELAIVEAKDAPEPKPGAAAPRAEARVRPIHVHASVTWPSREKEALLSVSAGWDSRERMAIVF